MSNVIAIDGPSSAGKSTIGYLFAKKIRYQFIDSGIIYRCLPYYLLKNNLPTDNQQQNASILKNLNLSIKTQDDQVKVYLDSEEITHELHTEGVRNLVATTSAQKEVRDAIKEKQIQLASQTNTVMSGRDIGTEVFPNSKLKFYLDADVRVRGQRRFLELLKKEPHMKLEDVIKELEERDYKDKTREVSPLYAADDAILIDTSNLNIDQVLELMLDYYQNSSYYLEKKL